MRTEWAAMTIQEEINVGNRVFKVDLRRDSRQLGFVFSGRMEERNTEKHTGHVKRQPCLPISAEILEPWSLRCLSLLSEVTWHVRPPWGQCVLCRCQPNANRGTAGSAREVGAEGGFSGPDWGGAAAKVPHTKRQERKLPFSFPDRRAR